MKSFLVTTKTMEERLVLDVQFGVFQMRINSLNKCVAMNKEDRNIDMKVLKL